LIEGLGETGAGYCRVSYDKQTTVLVAVATADQEARDGLPDTARAVQSQIVDRLPPATIAHRDRFSTPHATSSLQRGLMIALVAVPLLWLVPTLLFDRATWQRIARGITLRRFRSWPAPGMDIDSFVRPRLWSATALGLVQVAVAVWVMRSTFQLGSIQQATIVIGATLAVSAAPRMMHVRRVGRAVSRTIGQRAWWLLGTLVGVVAVAFALFVMYLGTTLQGIGGAPVGADYLQQRVAVGMMLIAIPIAVLAIAPVMLLRRIAMRVMRARRPEGGRAPILLLRSFADDGRRLRARSAHRRALVDRLSLRRWERFEEIVAASLESHGPVYAVSQLGERLPPPLGAVRMQLTNEEWQQRVVTLMAESSLICVTVGRSASLEWEIHRIAEAGHLHKTLFVLPPTDRSEHTKRLAVLASALSLAWDDLDVAAGGHWALAIRVPAGGARPQIVSAHAQEDVGYEIALELLRLATVGLPVGAPDPRPSGAQAPRPEIYAPGATPVVKPRWRRWSTWLVVCALSSAAGPVVFAAATGEEEGSSATIRLARGYTATAVAADPVAGGTYGLLDGVGLMRLDFSTRSGDLVTEVDHSDSLVAHDGWLFTASAATGTVQAVAPGESAVTWTKKGLQGARGLAAAGTHVYVLLPYTGEIRALDRETGRLVATTQLDGTPWASAADDEQVHVSLIDTSEIVTLEADGLTKIDEHDAPAGPEQLVLTGGTVWAWSVTEHRLVATAGPRQGTVIWTRSESPDIATNGKTLAVEGVELVSWVSPSGVLRRHRLHTRHAVDMAVTREGDIVTAAGGGFTILRSEPLDD
jgi:hypothetical protein